MPEKIKTNPETPFYFLRPNDSGVVPYDAVRIPFSPESLPSASGWQSSVYDLGAGPRTTIFEWRAVARVASGVSVRSDIQQYIVGIDPPYIDGNIGSGNANMPYTNKRRNFTSIGCIEADSSVLDGDNNYTFTASGLTQIYSRYFCLVWWNNTNVALAPSGNIVKFTPIPDEIQ